MTMTAKSVIIRTDDDGESAEEIIARIRRNYGHVLRSHAERQMFSDVSKIQKKEAAIRAAVDHKKLGDDY